MPRFIRVYFHAVLGGLGGLLGWMLLGELVSPAWSWWVAALVGGGLIGTMIGYMVVGVDALLDRALLRFARYAAYGVVLGAVGGALGFWIGDWVNYLLVPAAEAKAPIARVFGSMAARGLGWMVFGLAIGAAQGLAAWSVSKLWYGALGGSIGGLLAGAVFAVLIETSEHGTQSYTWGQAIGLVLLGACIGALIALVEEVLRPAALRVLRGWQEGREYSLTKPLSVLGRDEAADILLLRDMKVDRRHALIERRGGMYRMINTGAPSQQTLVNGKPVENSRALSDGDRIQLGNVLLKFTVRV